MRSLSSYNSTCNNTYEGPSSNVSPQSKNQTVFEYTAFGLLFIISLHRLFTLHLFHTILPPLSGQCTISFGPTHPVHCHVHHWSSLQLANSDVATGASATLLRSTRSNHSGLGEGIAPGGGQSPGS